MINNLINKNTSTNSNTSNTVRRMRCTDDIDEGIVIDVCWSFQLRRSYVDRSILT